MGIIIKGNIRLVKGENNGACLMKTNKLLLYYIIVGIKENTMKKWIIVLMMLVMTVGLSGCGTRANTSVVVSEEKIWPEAIGSDIPKLKENAIVKVSTLPTSTLITFEGISEEDYTTYIQTLEELGFEVILEENAFAKALKKDDVRVDISLLEDGNLLFDYAKQTN
jgi:hypothetical protein